MIYNGSENILIMYIKIFLKSIIIIMKIEGPINKIKIKRHQNIS